MNDTDDQAWQNLESALRAHHDWKLAVRGDEFEIRTRAGKVLCPAGPLSQLSDWLSTVTAEDRGARPRAADR